MAKRAKGAATLPYPTGAAAVREARKLEQAYSSFWAFCQLMNPDFYRDSRPHLRELCDTLQALIENRLPAPDGKPAKILAISEAPRHGKSYTMSMFNMWVLGRDKRRKIINVSYNDILSTRFARSVRDGISATKLDPRFRIFSDVFPGVRIKDGDAAMDLWSLEGSYLTFLAASFGSTITGMGCDIMIIDDPIKDHKEAFNERILQEKWDYYRNTLRSRIEKGGYLIVVMTRWATKDLIGRLLETKGDAVYVLNQPACLDEASGEMLCPDILSFEDWKDIRNSMDPSIFQANYQNMPVDVQGRMYTRFATYDVLPDGPGQNIAYVDTADTGSDYLCEIAARVIAGQAYVLDVVYTNRAMEVTEPMVARSLYENAVAECAIESNNGGRGFARNVRRLLWERFGTRRIHIADLNQRQNKNSRILSEASWIMDNMIYPSDWQTRWPEYARDMLAFSRMGKNAHDDAPDATTGLAEIIQSGQRRRNRFASGRGARR